MRTGSNKTSKRGLRAMSDPSGYRGWGERRVIDRSYSSNTGLRRPRDRVAVRPLPPRRAPATSSLGCAECPEVETEGARHRLVSQNTRVHVETVSQPGILGDGLPPAMIGEGPDVGQSGVGERECGRARHGAGHVGDAVVNHAVEDERRRRVRGGAAGLEATALIDGDIDEHGAGL